MKHPFVTGFHLSWLMHDAASPDETVPSRRFLSWNTRSHVQEQYDHHWSECGAGTMPGVEVHLHRSTVKPWIGNEYYLYRVVGNISLQLGDRAGCSFTRELTTRSRELAMQEFNRMRRHVRPQILPARSVAEPLP